MNKYNPSKSARQPIKTSNPKRLLFLLVENVRRTGLELTSRILKRYEGNLQRYRIKSRYDNKVTKKDQARITWTEAHNMVAQSPALSKHVRKRKTDLYFPVTFSKFEPLASDSNSLDGLNTHYCIMDELHAIKDRNLYDVMKQSMTAREQPILDMITTAGFVRECIFDSIYTYACNVLDGVIEDERFLAFIYELDDRSEWTDFRMWEKANPGLGVIKDFAELAANVERAKNDPDFYQRY